MCSDKSVSAGALCAGMSDSVLPGDRATVGGGYGVLPGRAVPVGSTEHDMDVPDADLLSGQHPAGQRGVGIECESAVLLHHLCPDLLHGRHFAGAYRLCPVRTDGAGVAVSRGAGVPQDPGPVRAVSVRDCYE